MIETFPVATEYSVSALPWSYTERGHFSLHVRRAHDDYWYVTDGFQPTGYMDIDGEWHFRDEFEDVDRFREVCYFNVDTALALADTECKFLTVNGWTVDDVLRRHNDHS